MVTRNKVLTSRFIALNKIGREPRNEPVIAAISGRPQTIGELPHRPPASSAAMVSTSFRFHTAFEAVLFRRVRSFRVTGFGYSDNATAQWNHRGDRQHAVDQTRTRIGGDGLHHSWQGRIHESGPVGQ